MRIIVMLSNWFIFTLLLFSPFLAFTQTDTVSFPAPAKHHTYALQAMYQNGYVFATNPFLKGKNIEAEKINTFQAFSLKFSTQTLGKKYWEQMYNYPNYGAGVYVADFFNPEEIGVPIALYGFFDAPFKRWDKLTFNYEIGFGATFHWKAFNPITNKYNVVIGAGESFLIDAGLNLEYLLYQRITICGGFSLTHFSNGALKKPNFGINTIAPKVGIKYNFYDKPIFIKQENQAFAPHNEWLVSAFGGLKNVIFDSANIAILEKYEGVDFPVLGISTLFNRQVSYKSKLGIGATFTYNGAVNAQAAVENNDLEPLQGQIGDKVLVSVYPSYELVINKASIILQPAVYIYRKKLLNQSPIFHQRIGLKYHFTDLLFVGITLVDYKFHVSDFIEWNIGYRIR